MNRKDLLENEEFPFFSIPDTIGVLNEFEKKHAPNKAYYSGNLDLLRRGGRVSVVGSRNPTPNGVRRAVIVSRRLVENGITVVSGLAEGIDTIAHQTALACNGRTIAVLGTPLNKPYPKSNHGLFERLASEQLVISQFPSYTPFQPKNFPIRNRTMALISHATIIIEASEKSGTVHQGWEALRLGRPLYLLENLVKERNLSWAQEMIKYGAQLLSQDNFEDLFYTIPSGIVDEECYSDFPS
ncbi:DNA-processing protein DprA [Spirosoma sp. HMF4905]|uniref:DNA-processing protein DprA n=1 Tax=Spirosoma arboris TaxID=2682092 RepID=A0A7K1SED1_9BACT|nr:DNA-processing protein DprA [Spirosoma arboris]MVM32149.1 DNA-processing protein DprA [Spirosoma arboris]